MATCVMVSQNSLAECLAGGLVLTKNTTSLFMNLLELMLRRSKGGQNMQGSPVATCHEYLLTDFGIFLASSGLSEAEGRKCGK